MQRKRTERAKRRLRDSMTAIKFYYNIIVDYFECRFKSFSRQTEPGRRQEQQQSSKSRSKEGRGMVEVEAEVGERRRADRH